MMFLCVFSGFLKIFQRNEGEVLGAFIATAGAIIVAFVASWLSRRNAERERRSIERKHYFQDLFLIQTELNRQKHQLSRVDALLTSIEQQAIKDLRVIFGKIPPPFDLNFLNILIPKVLSYEKSNNDLLILLVNYLHNLREINFLLEFENLNSVLENLKSNENRVASLISYFANIREKNISRTDIALGEILNRLSIELDAKDSKNPS